MGNCLVTTLKDSVTDYSLLKLGEMRLRQEDNYVKRIVINPSVANVTVTVTSPGYITNEAGTANLGTTVTLTSLIDNNVFISPGKYDVIISDKYALRRMSVYKTGGALTAAPIKMNLSDLYGAKNLLVFGIDSGELGDNNIELFTNDNFPALYNLNLFSFSLNYNLQGDIAKLSDGCTNITINNAKGITGALSAFSGRTNLIYLNFGGSSQITGTINNLAGNTAIQTIVLNSTSVSGSIDSLSQNTDLRALVLSMDADVSGNLSSLANKTELTILRLDNTAVTGDTSSLAGLTNLTTFTYTNTAITGTWPLT